MPIQNDNISSRKQLVDLLTRNESVVILKFGADWCGPCKVIEKAVIDYMNQMPDHYTCMVLDVDECIDLFSFLKSKKVVSTIPVILAYFKGNVNPLAPDKTVIGTSGVKEFFEFCYIKGPHTS